MKRYKPVDWVKPLHRLGRFPVDITSLFDNFEEAKAYVYTGMTAYAGQLISIIDETNKTVKVYKVIFDNAPANENTNALNLELINGTGNVITVDTYNQLTTEDAWLDGGVDTRYEGMMVYAKDSKKVYILIDGDNPNSLSSWQLVGSGSGSGSGTNETLDTNLTVAGLPHDLGNYSNGDVIAAGTSALDIIKAILQKRIYPSPAQVPTISLTGTETFPLSEVGSTLTIPAVSIKYNAGYFDKSNTAGSQDAASFTWSSPSITTVITNFTNISGETVNSSAITSYNDVVVAAGTNTVSYSASASYSAPSNYPKTNLGETVKDAAYTWTAGNATTSGKVSAIGVYRLFTNGEQGSSTFDGTRSIATGSDITDANPLNLVNTGSTFYVKFCAQNISKWDIYVPSVYSLSDIKAYDTITQQYNVDTNFTVLAEQVTKEVNGVEVTYNVYESVGTSGAQTLKITLAKA
jgi:hypothetical protein